MTLLRSSSAASFALAALLGGGAVPASAQGADTALTVEDCTVPGVRGPARCGTLRVWENRQARSGRRIGVHFVVLPATGGAAARDAVAPLAGGPGQAIVGMAGGVAQELAASRRERDVLLVDQRGTGKSSPLNCRFAHPDTLSSYLGAWYPPGRAATCAAELAPTADVTQYTTDAFADDLDEVRQALGYERLTLYGTSYGTRAALVYARRHPARVRALLLHGIFPVDARVPLQTAPDAERAMEGVLAACDADPACHAAFPDPRGDLRAALARLAQGPVPATVMDPASGDTATVLLTRDLFVEGLRYLTYGAGGAARIPSLLHQAARGDFGPAADQAVIGRRLIVYDGAGGDGLYLASTCSEDVAFFDEAEGVRLAEGTYLGAYRVRDQKAVCRAWPHRPVSRGFLAPVRSDAPVLVLSGQWDPVTPPAYGDQVLRTLPNGRHVVIPHAGHGFGGVTGDEGCINGLVNAFIATADAKSLDAGCVERIRRIPFPTTPVLTRPIPLAAEAMPAYVGAYQVAGGGFRIDVTLEDGRLIAAGGGGRFPMVPVAPDRFRIPVGLDTYLVFTREGGRATAVTLEQGGAVDAVLPRIP